MSNVQDTRWEVSLRKQVTRSGTIRLPIEMVSEDDPSLIDPQKIFDALPEIVQCVELDSGLITKTARILLEQIESLPNGCYRRRHGRWNGILVGLNMTVDQIKNHLLDASPVPSKWLWVIMENERIVYLGKNQKDAIEWLNLKSDNANLTLTYIECVYHWMMNGKHLPAFGYFAEEDEARRCPAPEGAQLVKLDPLDAAVDEEKPRFYKRWSGK